MAEIKEYMEKTLIDMIESAKGGVEKGVDFVIQEAPKLVQEILLWKFYEALIYASVALLFLICLWGLNWHLKRRFNDGYDSFGRVAQTIVCMVISLIISLTTIVPNVKEMVKISVAPRVYLVEYASDLIKEKTVQVNKK